MKVGFLARTLMITEKYWNKLQDKADCWWAVTQKEFYETLIENDYSKIVFHQEKRYLEKGETSGNPFIPINPGESENIIASRLEPDLWIAENLNKLNYVPKKVPWIQIFHSLPLKKHFFYPPVLEYDLMLLPGEYHKNELVRRLGLEDDDYRLKVVGWPRVDDFINNVFDREEIMHGLGLDSSRKTLMYAPTWGWGFGSRGFFSRWDGQEYEAFEKLCWKAKEMDLNFIVKLHCLSLYSNNKEMVDIADRYGVLWLTKEPSCTQIDPNPFLWISDVLISDLSGIIADFMVLNRPIIYIDPDENRDAWDDADMPKNFRAGHVVNTLDELINAIADSISCPERFKDQRQAICSKLFYKLDGKATDRGVQEIISFAEDKRLI